MLEERRSAAVIGGGVMGRGIAQVLAIAGFSVRLHDTSDAAVVAAINEIEHGRFGVRRAVELGKLSESESSNALKRLSSAGQLEDAVYGCSLIVEAVPEEYQIKIDVLRAAALVAPPGAILTTNTGGLSIAALAAGTQRPERVIGWHWFNPAPVMRLVEIIVHDRTDPAVTDELSEISRHVGKAPQVINDHPFAWGFVGNRINRAVRVEASRIVEDGVATPEQVDAIMRDGFRWPMGPFEGQQQQKYQ